jgi:hypothetical protein
MAVKQHSGSRRYSETQYYLRLFESATNLNGAFDQVLDEVRRLKSLGLFRSAFTGRFLEACPLAVEELRLWANFEVGNHAGERAYDQWGDATMLRRKSEQKFREQAERRRKRLAEEARKGSEARRTLRKRRSG